MLFIFSFKLIGSKTLTSFPIERISIIKSYVGKIKSSITQKSSFSETIFCEWCNGNALTKLAWKEENCNSTFCGFSSSKIIPINQPFVTNFGSLITVISKTACPIKKEISHNVDETDRQFLWSTFPKQHHRCSMMKSNHFWMGISNCWDYFKERLFWNGIFCSLWHMCVKLIDENLKDKKTKKKSPALGKVNEQPEPHSMLLPARTSVPMIVTWLIHPTFTWAMVPSFWPLYLHSDHGTSILTIVPSF